MNTKQEQTRGILSGLAPYQGAWGNAELIHLLRRTLFGVTKADLTAFAGMNMNQVVDSLLNYSSTPPLPPINNYNTATFTDPNVPLGQTWVGAIPDGPNDFYRRYSLRTWWIQLMVNQERNIREKMVLFWQNHLVTNYSEVGVSWASYSTNILLRASALGNFKQLIKDITIDTGMLKYLNGYQNNKNSPDENYARELQELFTLGDGAGYTEDDVKAAAKVLTGFRISNTNMAYYFDATKHDINDKVFSSFYNDTVITGLSGAAGEDELDALVEMIFTKNEVALFMCRNLYRFFVYYEIDNDIETNVIIPLANTFRNNNYEIMPVMAQLLKSEHFFDIANRSCLIKSPIDFAIGLCRQFNVAFPDNTDVVLQGKHYNYINSQLQSMQQSPGEPPTVAGWSAYYQEPAYHEMWINSVTYPARVSFADKLITTGYSNSGYKIIFDIIGFTESLDDPFDPNALIAEAVSLLYGLDVSQNVRDFMKSILLSGQSQDSYWTVSWDNYIQDPTNMTYYQEVYNRLQALYKYILDNPEHQLS
ncbi:MAG: DUF1800 domain-containing protein [Bacteroidales bacterium]